MKFYGIRDKITKTPCGWYARANGEDVEGSPISFTLDSYTKHNIWLVPQKETAERALSDPQEWFNADYDTPHHWDHFAAVNYEVFEVNIP